MVIMHKKIGKNILMNENCMTLLVDQIQSRISHRENGGEHSSLCLEA